MIVKVAIVEDEKPQQLLIKTYIDQFSSETGYIIEYSFFEDGMDIITNYKNNFDILLMDIQMPQMDGIKAAEIIRQRDKNVIIIFITNLAQYAIEGYSVNAMNFLVKPISYSFFSDKLRRAIEWVEKKWPKFIQIKTDHGLVRLQDTEIVYVEMKNRKLLIVTGDKEYRYRASVQDIERALNSKSFFRCHVGFLINLQYVKQIEHDFVIVGGHRIPVSRHRKKELLDAFTNYLGETM
jgi:DNA-binding LytR/AlgR family response regulator